MPFSVSSSSALRSPALCFCRRLSLASLRERFSASARASLAPAATPSRLRPPDSASSCNTSAARASSWRRVSLCEAEAWSRDSSACSSIASLNSSSFVRSDAASARASACPPDPHELREAGQ
eukprot:225061-Prorocentrum_minimum.AAC.1